MTPVRKHNYRASEQDILDAVSAVRKYYPDFTDEEVERQAVRLVRQRTKMGWLKFPIEVDEI